MIYKNSIQANQQGYTKTQCMPISKAIQKRNACLSARLYKNTMHANQQSNDKDVVSLTVCDSTNTANPQHTFLRKGSKAVCSMSQICGM
jgi:hypothetical protein